MSRVVVIAIGALSLNAAVERPADLDARLIAATGCGAGEIVTIVSAGADRAAQAIHPFLTDPGAPDVVTLAREIAADPGAPARILAHYLLTLGVAAATALPAPADTGAEGSADA